MFSLACRIATELWLLERRKPRMPADVFAARQKAVYRSQAQRIRRLCTDLQGLWIKLGQFLSTRADVLPAEYTSELAQLQDLVPAFPTAQALETIQSAYGRSASELFTRFEEQPVAAASLGQVHRAWRRLPDGETEEPVAVKILRPGIEKVVENDLSTLRWIVRAASRWTRFGRRVDLAALQRELAEITGQEMDYTIEAAHAEAFRQNLPADGSVYAPRIHADLTRQRVLVMEYVEGLRVDRVEELRKAGIDPRRVAENLVRTYLQQVLRDGFFHADPHPGNLFVRPGGALTFIDFGMMARISPQDRTAFTQLVGAAITRDLDGVVAAVRALGFLRPGADAPVLKKAIAMALDQLSGLPIERPDSQEFQAFLSEMRDFLYTEPFQLPVQYAFLGRAIGILLGITASLDPELRLVPLLRSVALPMLGLDGESRTDRPATNPTGAGVWGALRESLLTAYRLPRRLERLAERAEEGQVHIRVDTAGIERRLAAVSRSARSVRTAILAGSATVSATLLTVAHHSVEAGVLWVVAVVLGILSLVGR